MGFRHFPEPKAPRGVEGGPCPDPNCKGKLKSWDCGCAWGCELCWVSYECTRCGLKAKHGDAQPSAPRPPKPPRPKVTCPECNQQVANLDHHKRTAHPGKKCPHCGAWKKGLDQHIRDKHGPCTVTGVVGTPLPVRTRYRPPLQPLGVSLDCPECGAPMQLRRSKFGLFYGCTRWPGCDGTHGAHANGLPLGTPADKETKRFRMMAHEAFDRLWKPGPAQVFGDRNRAYRWMQEKLGLTSDQAHIAKFDIEQCKRLIEALWEFDDPA